MTESVIHLVKGKQAMVLKTHEGGTVSLNVQVKNIIDGANEAVTVFMSIEQMEEALAAAKLALEAAKA